MKRILSMIIDDIFVWKREMYVFVRRKINGIKKIYFIIEIIICIRI